MKTELLRNKARLTDVIQMEVTDDNTINVRSERSFWHDVSKVRESSFVIEAHMLRKQKRYLENFSNEKLEGSSNDLDKQNS